MIGLLRSTRFGGDTEERAKSNEQLTKDLLKNSAAAGQHRTATELRVSGDD